MDSAVAAVRMGSESQRHHLRGGDDEVVICRKGSLRGRSMRMGVAGCGHLGALPQR